MTETNLSSRVGVQSLFYNTGFLVFSTVTEKAIRFVYVIVLARGLGPEMLGLYNFGLAWYLIFLPLGLWGLGVLLSIYLGKKPSNAEDVVASNLFVRLVTTTVAALCCLFIGLLNNQDSITQSVIGIFAIALVGRSLAVWGRECFVAVELSHYSAVLEIGFRLIEVLSGLIYLLLGGDIIGVCAIHSACWVLEAAAAYGLVRRRLGFRKISAPVSSVRHYATEAFPIAMNAFLWVALRQCGFVILKHMSTDIRELGYYAVAFQLVANTILIPTALGRAALPILSRAHTRGTGESMILLEAMLKICAFCAGVLIILVIVYDTYILQLLFGQKYLMASGAMFVCSIAMITWYALPIANNILNAGTQYVQAAINIGIALIINIVVSIYLTPIVGEMAPAFGLLAGGTIALIMHLTVIHRTIGKISWWSSVIKPNTSVGLAVIVTWNLKQYGGIGLVIGLVCLLSCFAGWKMFTREEMGYFVKLIPWLQRT